MESIELAYFVYPACDGNCAHCWSKGMLLGSYKRVEWHEKLINSLSKNNYLYKEIKLSGGEPFLNKDIGKIAEMIRQKLVDDKPIVMLTSGRPFVSRKTGMHGVLETKNNLKKMIYNFENISIQMSIDEYHLAVLKNKGYNDIQSYIKNFIYACEEIAMEERKFLGPQLKIHCEMGRKKYHREQIFAWFPTEWWGKYTILTEGLVRSGNARNLRHSFELKPGNWANYFLLPGVDFYEKPLSEKAEKFYDEQNNRIVYMDNSDDTSIIIADWWNLISKKAIFYRVKNN